MGVIYNLRKLSENFYKLPQKKIYFNISNKEQKSLFNLRNNKDIIIKKADIGGNIHSVLGVLGSPLISKIAPN